MALRTVDFSDGYTTSSAPTAGSVAQNSLATYASDAAFVTGKGSAATDGDKYYNTTTDVERSYQNGAWVSMQVETADLTALTAPAIGDLMPVNDVSVPGPRKITLENMFKVLDGFTEDTAPAVGDEFASYDISAATAKKVLLGSLVAGSLRSGWVGNLGLANATTTNSNDSIKIQGAAAALSSTNPLYVNLPTVSSPGRVTRFSATADVTINLTGAHWGLGTNGDFTDVELRVYAINDNGTLKWGVSNQGGLRTIADTASHTTQTSVTTQPKMLVNSALTSGTWPCHEVGWFNANFDDTGGAAEDLWAVQTAAGKINVGIPVPDQIDETAYTPTGSFTGNVTYTGSWSRNRDKLKGRIRVLASGAVTPGSTAFKAVIPSTLKINTGKLLQSSSLTGSLGVCDIFDTSASTHFFGNCTYASTTEVHATVGRADGTYLSTNTVEDARPMTWASGDYLEMTFEVPILGWSGN